MSTTTMTLTDFLLARLAEDEQFVLRQEPEYDNLAPYNLQDRWLADVAAKRRIVEQLQRHGRLVAANAEKHVEASRGGLANQEQITALRTHGWELGGRLEALRMAVDSLAQPYADHPDFREEWRA